MIKLSREIRFALVPPGHVSNRSSANTWAGWPASDLLVPHLTLRLILKGKPDPRTGYLCNIKVVDHMLQDIVVNHLIPKYWQANQLASISSSLAVIAQIVAQQWPELPETYGEVEAIELDCSPYTRYTIFSEEPNMVLLTQQFEFSAAHRLHCRQLSDEQNRQIFGKCNHPSGHGHNYVVEVCVGLNGQEPGLSLLETAVKGSVIDRLDHKHLNEDIEQFRDINPSVENIAKQIFVWLNSELSPLTLKKVRVYETPKTWAECDSIEN
jgi:6-pyruvoyltetrahydropterin/6-carboxytetrahydropterin synthase